MINKPVKIEWSSPEYAKRWKEGSQVLILRLDSEITDYRAIEICQYFRPDWVDNPKGYGDIKMVFAQLTELVRTAYE